MNQPDFGLGDAAGGVVSDYSDGVPMISYALVDADGAVLRAYDAERSYYSASTVKIGVLVAALREVQRGTWHLDDEWQVTHEFTSMAPGAGRYVMEVEETEPTLGSPGHTVTLARVLERMIVVSANCATNMCFEALGPDPIATAFADAGVHHTAMQRPYSDEAGLRAGLTNRTTALDLARFMAALVRGELLDAERTAYAMQLLRERVDPVIGVSAAALAAANGWQLDTGGKGGSVEGIGHDLAFLNIDGRMLCLCICTRAYLGPQYQAAIQAITAALLSDPTLRVTPAQ